MKTTSISSSRTPAQVEAQQKLSDLLPDGYYVRLLYPVVADEGIEPIEIENQSIYLDVLVNGELETVDELIADYQAQIQVQLKDYIFRLLSEREALGNLEFRY